MRILHVVPTYYPAVRYGGPIVAVHGLCAALARRGHDVHVFTTSVDGEADSAVPLGVPVKLDGVNVRYFAVPALRRLYWARRMAGALESEVRQFSLVHTHSVFLWPTWAAARAARRHGVPYLLAPRGMLAPALIRNKNALLKTAWISLIERRNIERASGLHVTSELEAQELGALGFTLPAIYEVPNGVANEENAASADGGGLSAALESALAGESPVLLCLGRIHWKKGLDRLISALVEVPEAKLLIVGNDEEGYAKELVRHAQAAGVLERVSFPGPVFGAAKERLYRRATLFVLPSRSENFGNVVLEAMAQECPVIVTPEVGAAPIVADSGGGAVVPGEPRALARAIRELIANPDLRHRMGQRGRQWVLDKHSWDGVASRMLSVYEEVIEARQKG